LLTAPDLDAVPDEGLTSLLPHFRHAFFRAFLLWGTHDVGERTTNEADRRLLDAAPPNAQVIE
jgi:hypothetical protein